MLNLSDDMNNYQNELSSSENSGEQPDIPQNPSEGEGQARDRTKTAGKLSLKKEAFEWIDVLATAMIAVVIIFTLIFRVATIEGESMENTLFEGQRVVITKLAYKPKQGDIVVISRNIENSALSDSSSGLPIIKRIIATENQMVNIDYETGDVMVDGVVIKEDYIKERIDGSKEKGDIVFPVTVPEGCVFVLGDNRNESLDSRFSRIGDGGMVDTRYILGRAVFRIFPLSDIGGLG